MTISVPEFEESCLGRALDPEAICLSEQDISDAACKVDPNEEHEQGWARYLRALALQGLRKWVSKRKVQVVIGPEIEPEQPGRLLVLNGRVTQLVCGSTHSEQAEVSLQPWHDSTTAPQLVLLAQVDEEHGVISFPGVLDATSLVGEVQRLKAAREESVEVAVERFAGGLERLLRWTTLLAPEALPRRGIRISASEKTILGNHLKDWVESLLASDSALIPVTASEGATRGIMPIRSDHRFLEQNRIAREIRLLSPAIVRNSSGDYVAHAACVRPSIWAHTSLAEIQIWKNSELIWRQRATVHEPIQGPVDWPLEDLSPMEKLTVCLRPYGAIVGEQGVFTLVADEQSKAHLNEQIIQKYFEESLDVLTSAGEAKIKPELMAELMARVALNLSADEKLPSDYD